MKILLFILVSFITTTIYSQNELPTRDGKVYYELIDSSVTGSAATFYAKSKMWFADAFRNSKEVIQVDDKENSTIMGKGRSSLSQGFAPYSMRFSVKIISKENKYKVQFYDFIILSGTSEGERSAEWYNDRKGLDKVKRNVNDNILSIIEELKKFMAKKTDSDF